MGNFCMLCGAELILHDNQMTSDVEGWEDGSYSEDDDSMITYAQCPHCGVYYEMTDASNNDKENDPTYVGIARLFYDKDEEQNNE